MVFQPAGDAVLCRCKHVIDMSRGKEVPVETEPAVTVSGLRYNMRGERKRWRLLGEDIVLLWRKYFMFVWCGKREGMHATSSFRCETRRDAFHKLCTCAFPCCRWYQRLWPRKKPPPPKTRRRASCTHCHTNHCLECKQLWHEGDCQKLSREEEKVEPGIQVIHTDSAFQFSIHHFWSCKENSECSPFLCDCISLSLPLGLSCWSTQTVQERLA